MFRVLFLAKIIVVCIPADFPIILCFHFSCFLYSVLKVHGVLSASLQSVPVPLLLRKNAFGEAVFTTSVVGSMWTVHLSLSAFVDSPHFASPFGEVVFTTSMVGSSGLEPPTSRLSGVRSNHLSYEPMSARTPVSCLRPARFPGSFRGSLDSQVSTVSSFSPSFTSCRGAAAFRQPFQTTR